MKTIKNLLLLTMVMLAFSGCKKEGTGVFLFSLEDDKTLGAQVDDEIRSSDEFSILDRDDYPTEYAYIDEMRDMILDAGEVNYRDEFVWELAIIDNDSTLNAFCTPGGYIYIYTGLIKYLDNSSSLAGVMGHEIAHADRRHSSKQMQQQFGIGLLLQLVSGGNDPGLLTQVAASLTSLAFSRADETESDEYSVKYLCPSDFDAAGAASFFEKLEAEGSSQIPAFLSTHPSPDDRVEHIHEEADAVECSPDIVDPMINGMTYEAFKDLF